MGRRLPEFTRKVIYCAHPIAARFSLPFELPAYYCAVHFCTAAHAPEGIWEPLPVGAFDGSKGARAYVQSGEYSHIAH